MITANGILKFCDCQQKVDLKYTADGGGGSEPAEQVQEQQQQRRKH